MARRIRPAWRAVVVVTTLALAGLALTVPAAADVTCTGTIGAQTIDDNLRVPDGASCTLCQTNDPARVATLGGTAAVCDEVLEPAAGA